MENQLKELSNKLKETSNLLLEDELSKTLELIVQMNELITTLDSYIHFKYTIGDKTLQPLFDKGEL